jgi:hypothetical protein
MVLALGDLNNLNIKMKFSTTEWVMFFLPIVMVVGLEQPNQWYLFWFFLAIVKLFQAI